MSITTYPRAVVFWALTAVGICRAEGIDRSAMLRAIAQVESGNRPSAVGKKGERTQWQFTRTVWQKHTMMPFEMAGECPHTSLKVARAHLAEIIAGLERRWRSVTPAAVARAWNPRAPRDYADRVVNLYEEFARAGGQP